jgi:hypothetical protein
MTGEKLKDKKNMDNQDNTVEKNSIWFGKYKNMLFLFDNTFKIEGIDQLFGYASSCNHMQQFDINSTEIHRNPHVSDLEKKESIMKYREWRCAEGDTYIKEQLELEELFKNRQKNKEIVAKNQKYLEKIGKIFWGVKVNSTKEHRNTHCYLCKKTLDSSSHIECSVCGWLICECGACGCGFNQIH